MDAIETTTIIQSIVDLLTEAYAGPPNPSSTWFIDNEPDSGILGLIAGVSPSEAAWSTSGGDQPGTSIAAHVEHLRWSLANTNAEIRGEPGGKWAESWSVLGTDEAGWNRLRQELRSEFETLLQQIQQQKPLSGDYLTGALALLPHAAYHLGNIRQLIERARAADK